MNITILIIVAVAIISFFLGYYLGQGNILRRFRKTNQKSKGSDSIDN